MISLPMLQLALDYVSLPTALAMAIKVAPEVDVIEVGTPLCKAVGLEAIRAVREVCPDKIILADLKTPDVGGLEAAMAFDAGADMMSVIGGATLATVAEALQVARKRGKEIVIELTGVRDILRYAVEWRQIGVGRIVYHREWDAQAAGRQWNEDDKVIIRRLIDMGYKVTITGGLAPKLLPFFADLAVSIVICGRGIREQPDPRAAAREMREMIARLWGGTGAARQVSDTPLIQPALADKAAKSIRFGVSDMGLLLTVDGRNCPGCDTTARLCRDTATSIQCPPGVRADDVLNGIYRSFGRSEAAGRVADNQFYLDPARLNSLSRSRVMDLITATGQALQHLGYQADLAAGLQAANQAWGN